MQETTNEDRDALIERERIEAVFCLGGGELDDHEIDGIGFYSYEGAPSYIRDPEDCYAEAVSYRTIVACELYGAARLPIGWTRVDAWTSSGETECYCVDCEDAPDPCPLCEGDRLIYIGDGWREILIRTDTDYEHAPLFWLASALAGCWS